MGVTVGFQWVFRVDPTVTFFEHFSGWSDVGSVQEYDSVEACHGGVHGGYAGVF